MVSRRAPHNLVEIATQHHIQIVLDMKVVATRAIIVRVLIIRLVTETISQVVQEPTVQERMITALVTIIFVVARLLPAPLILRPLRVIHRPDAHTL